MALLLKMFYKRRAILILTICVSGLTAANTLWWNSQLSAVINMVRAGIPPPKEMIIGALLTMLIMGAVS